MSEPRMLSAEELKEEARFFGGQGPNARRAARLFGHIVTQAEHIKALADALEAERALSGAHDCQCREGYICVTCQGTAALRLVGRIP